MDFGFTEEPLIARFRSSLSVAESELTPFDFDSGHLVARSDVGQEVSWVDIRHSGPPCWLTQQIDFLCF